MGNKTGRACKPVHGRQINTFDKWKCFNCGKTFGSKRKWWGHLWSIF